MVILMDGQRAIFQSLFSWETADGDEESITFHDAELRVPMGPYPVGTQLWYIEIDFTKGTIHLCAPNRIYATFALSLQVGAAL